MRALLKKRDMSEEVITLPDEAIFDVALLKRGNEYFVFDGYLGGYMYTAVFTECKPPLILPELNLKPAPRRFMGQKPKEEDNG